MKAAHTRFARSLGTSLGVFALGLFMLPSPVFAHPGAGSIHGVIHGFTHPLFGWDHLLAMVTIGLWAGQRGGRAMWALPAAFVGMMVVGGILGTLGVHVPGVETGILASVLVLGALVAVSAQFPLPLSIAAVTLFALFHGHAHGAEMPATVSGLFYGLGFVTATILLHTTGLVAVVSSRHWLGERRQVWIRLAGATVCLTALALGLF